MELVYKTLPAKDIAPAMELVWQVFAEFEAPDYSQEGVAEFKQYIEPTAIGGRIQEGGLILWGCYSGQNIVGLCALRPPNEISLLFVSRAYHHRGIAHTLMQCAQEYSVQLGANEMKVHSSPYAQEAYRHMGFKDTAPEQTVNGLRFIPMTKAL